MLLVEAGLLIGGFFLWKSTNNDKLSEEEAKAKLEKLRKEFKSISFNH